MGASRRAHHAAQEQMRADTRVRDAMEAAQREAEARMQQQAEALRKQMEQTYAVPQTQIATLGERGGGVRTAQSQRETTTGLARGIAQLRIPLNLGGMSGSGLNIG